MRKSKFQKAFLGALTITGLCSPQAHAAARFSGGLCISQGSWLQAALQQSDVITGAIETLRNDPDCAVMLKALSEVPKVERAGSEDVATTSFANTYQELKSIHDYMRPDRLGAQLKATDSVGSMTADQFRDVVFQVVFNKSFESIRELHSNPDFAHYSSGQKQAIENVSGRLKSFLNRSKDVVNMSMATSQKILAALPQSRNCFHHKPSTAAIIFGAVAHSAAALTTGGQVNGMGEFVSSILQYSREMKYMDALSPLEKARFNASVSCLIESTSESYCGIRDAETSLDYFKDLNLSAQQKAQIDSVIKNGSKDIVANPLGGLIILMRDVPVLSAWMQRVLFGIDPKLSIEAEMKNKYLEGYLAFIKSVNTLQADFRDQESLYIQNSRGKDNAAKLGQVRAIFDSIVSTMSGAGRRGGDGMNFFSKIFASEDAMSVNLLNSTLPSTFNKNTKDFDVFWNDWAAKGEMGFSDADTLLRTIKDQTWIAIEKARREANEFFASRMVVDPQNLLSEAMKGPGVSAYQALINIRGYYANLAVKLSEGAAELERDPTQESRREQMLANVALMKDSVEKADRIIKALRGISNIRSGGEISTEIQSQRTMDVIYESANMMVSRDSFFTTRAMTAVQMDLTDTLWRKKSVNSKQVDLFLSVGPEIISRLSGFFTTNPVVQRADVSAAKMIHLENLKSSEKLFAKTIFNQIRDLDCKLEGAFYCGQLELDPTTDQIRILMFNERLVRSRQSGWKGLDFLLSSWMNPTTEDSEAHRNVRAKLCIQSLAFESRSMFKEICRGAKLTSDFADGKDSFGLNLDFDKRLQAIESALTDRGNAGRIDTARNLGVCSLNEYLRKNHLFYMYREYQRAD